ncbi:glycosyltransferase family 2 protein [Nonlabens agnitus]|uniref:Glycosyltransferase 2-like domain-containing protein n=1 Tax=Nonlabens agnitus TaxID=870484 RepID=A0A2S9WV44_9FLAO|nr:glycosyltransferase family 2 protein [Nonlabens agnitus]PRP67236.1 hypothetical protein BST86_09045 [Nonlabens agnitus]
MIQSLPFFSIIIPTYNVKSTIEVAIKSILDQSFKDFEILILDGKSTDGTIEIIKEFQSKDDRIRIHSEDDTGVYDAMNKGIAISKGLFLYFLGADDYLVDPEVLADVRRTLDQSNIFVLYGNVNSPVLGHQYDGIFSDAKIFHKNIAHQAIFYKKNVFEKVGIYPLQFKVHADWALNLKWFFDPTVSHHYFERSIAFFAPGGLSSRKVDNSFRVEMITMYYLLARSRHSIIGTLSLMLRGLFSRLTR